MSISTSACYDFAAHSPRVSPRASSRKATPYSFFGSAAIACLVVGCAWTVYTNVLGASIYPAVSSNFDVAVVRRPSAASFHNRFAFADSSVAVETPPAVSAPARPVPSFSFDDRFAASEPQGVAPNPIQPAPPAEAPKLASAAPPADGPKPQEVAAAQVALNIPLPAARPAAARVLKNSGASIHDMTQRAKAAVMSVASAEKPTLFERLFGKPSSQGSLLSFASADASFSGGLGQSQNIASAGTVPLYDRQTAVYDISAHMVYLPDGTKLEAHSGLGSSLDDPRSANIRMRGVTPPHLYDLKPRESLFHGVAALRLTPVGGEDSIYGRSGLLAHTYMLGPNGDSNGCVSFRDYGAFLNAYHQGVRRLAVVAHL